MFSIYHHQKPDYEFSEMVLYEAQLLLEAGRAADSLKHLQNFEQHICDPLNHWETKGRVRERGRRIGKGSREKEREREDRREG